MGIEQISVPNIDPKLPQGGLLKRSEAVNLIQESIGGTEYKQQVSARVTKVYVHEKELPKRRRNDGVITRAWNRYGNIDVVINHNEEEIRNIGPLCSHFNCMPLVDEEVTLVDHDGQIFYSFPLNRMGKVNSNRTKRIVGEKDVFEPTTYYARPVAISPGDTVFQGRFGNYIKMTSEPERNGKPAYPKIVIGNNQDRDMIQVEHKNYDKSFPHFHNPNSIGSCIEITSGPLPNSLQPSAVEKDMEEFYDSAGDCITVTSDRIIMNTKEGDISLHSPEDINLTSIEAVNIVGLKKVCIGKTDGQNPIVKGNEMKNFLMELLSTFEGFCATMEKRPNPEKVEVTHIQMGAAVEEMRGKIEAIKKNYIVDNPILFSKKVYAE
jgi:hypothetical protein